MSLYREPGRRSARLVVVAALSGLLLAAAGFGIGRATAPEPSLTSQVADLRSDTAPVADALELVAIHYGASNQTTREAARAQLDRASTSFATVASELAAIDSHGTDAARAAIDKLTALVASSAPRSEVELAAARAERAVRSLSGEQG